MWNQLLYHKLKGGQDVINSYLIIFAIGLINIIVLGEENIRDTAIHLVLFLISRT
ncbi:TPA: hypothetical protein ACMWM6_002151 [Clostridioides difficile]|mgnify:CR=1 FL=1|uniref:hypothetical protein n=1 Tax=Clostridioides difficile TaxID=1496 RepID=UPI000235952C|nr:hypothetical protein [Clostridioides difficile]EHJ40348.1 hypothetical protein HMPREF9945_00511 [Clostridioides difficile 70-100-2010]EQG47334.1 hypothetical protein QIU_0450 [Clostridioides difficile DA00132]EQI31707.1 hypothetical protein QOQ_0431 [Clostridioides difficile Y171]EQI48284.1 hypothetical protein QQ1_0410 [Clostridioides difficile Y247]EQI53475.1 hypothetical protein QQ5_0501 [Clostridioides difficile Y270]CCL09240.1 hypothetical protein BN169_160073 [Clostridioides difficil